MDARETAAAQPQTQFWDMVMDPKVTNEHFNKVHREYFERREVLEKAFKRSISRREYLSLAAGISTAFGLAGFVGSASVPQTAHAQSAPTQKGVKKGTLRIGYINTLDCCLLDYVLEKKGIIQSMGWDVKFVGQPSGPQVMEAFIANEIDFAYVGSNTPGLAAQRGIQARHVVGGMMGMGGWNVTNALYSAGVTDLQKYFEFARKRKAEGKLVTLATQVPGTLTHACCMITIRDYGMDPEKDFDIKYLPPAEVSSTVISGVVDSNAICEQYDSGPEYFNKGKVIGHCLDSGHKMMHCDGLPEQTYTQCIGLAARPGLPDEMVAACVEAHKRACEWMANNLEETIRIAVEVAGTTPAVEYVAMFKRSRWHYGVNFESVDSVWNNTMRKIGMAKKNFKVDELIDTKHAMNLKPGQFQSIAGVKEAGSVDVTSDAFRRQVWAEAMSRFKKASLDGVAPFERAEVTAANRGQQCAI